MFIRLIVHTFQLVFSAGTMFFSHNKSVNSVFQPAYQHNRTGPKACERYFDKSSLFLFDSALTMIYHPHSYFDVY
jgi:hypothetical protein